MSGFSTRDINASLMGDYGFLSPADYERNRLIEPEPVRPPEMRSFEPRGRHDLGAWLTRNGMPQLGYRTAQPDSALGLAADAFEVAVQHPWKQFNALMSGDIPLRGEDGRTSPQAIGAAFDIGGAAVTGGYAGAAAGAVPRNALGSAGGRAASHLDMSKGARLKRAQEMGFDPAEVWYHNSRFSDIDAFYPRGLGVFMARSPHMEFGPNVYPTHLRLRDVARVDFGDILEPGRLGHLLNMDKLRAGGGGVIVPPPDVSGMITALNGLDSDRLAIQWLQKAGFDAVDHYAPSWISGDGIERIVFDPRNIRSVNAAFDPAQSHSANLLASAGLPLNALSYGEDR